MLYRSAPALFMEGQRKLGLKKKEKVNPSSARAKLRFFDVCSSLRALLDVDEVEHYNRAGSEAPRLVAGAPAGHVRRRGTRLLQGHEDLSAALDGRARDGPCAARDRAGVCAVSARFGCGVGSGALPRLSPQGSGVDHGIDAKRIAQWKKALAKGLSPVAARAMQQPLSACLERHEMRDLAGYLEGAEQTALRAALLVAQDCAVVQDNEQGQVRDLVQFALSEDHFLLREKLSMTIV